MVKNTLKSRNSGRSRTPNTEEFKRYMSSSWSSSPSPSLEYAPPSNLTLARRAKLSAQFLGDRLIIEAGDMKVRANDTDYRFRPDTNFAHLTGFGMDYEPGAVLVFEPTTIHSGSGGNQHKSHRTHLVTLYIPQMKDRSTPEFYTSAERGEFWVGRRPDLDVFAKASGIKVKDISELAVDKKKLLLPPHRTRTISEKRKDAKLLEACSELRLVKDTHEIQQMRDAVAATKDGFERVIRELPRAKQVLRGERVVEGEFIANALERGNSVGYETIAAAGEHATTLHWNRNTGKINDGELLLLDAGVELDSLYTADITRTMPISGEFNHWQRQIYEVVLEAANAAFKKAKPGNKFKDVHDEAMRVIAHKLYELKILKVTPEEALSKDGQQHRRWMCHGTSHHLGIDVHDCAAARNEEYKEGVLKPGMVFTIEPGLYFKSDDELVPNEYKGIGIRIEDDILITEDGAENLSAAIPRNVEHLQSWIKNLQRS